MKYSKIPVARSIVALCVAKNINHVVISPGSRNAPLTIGFTHHPEVISYSIVDERCAAFFALGMSQQLNQPVALVCTSGSAVLNYYPAIAEAYYSDIPLVVISADRPIERIDIGDGQTIRQKNVFANHILYSANLHSALVLEDEKLDQKLQQKQFETSRHNEREINLALNTAIEEKGPVHINVPFYEPLYETVEDIEVKPLQILPESIHYNLSEKELQPYADIWNSSKRKLILVGSNYPNTVEQHFLDFFAEDDSVIVMAETISNLHQEKFFTRIDTLIGPIESAENSTEIFKALQPEVLVTFGGMLVSKKIKAFLRKYQPVHHWHIDEKKAYNTFFALNKHFVSTANHFFQRFLTMIQPVQSDYSIYWSEVNKRRNDKHNEYLSKVPFSDLKVFQKIVNTFPKHLLLQLGNSSIIRYAQLFNLSPSIRVFCNRGTSGIDGSTSTAIGAACASESQTLLISGDLSFFYDSNALWNNYIPKNFRIIVINNQGGGIFRILPGNKNTENFEKYLETVHQLNAKPLCEMFGFEYSKATNFTEMEYALKDFYAVSEKPRLLEIFTPRKINDEVLLNYFSAVLD